MTKRRSPHFLSVNDWRGVVANNARINHVVFELETDETWLPTVMRDAEFFPSNNEVKKNRPDLWRDLVPGETVKLAWAKITIERI